VLAALVAGRLAARGASLGGGGALLEDAAIIEAVRWARRKHGAALAAPWDVGGALGVLVPR
jgi:hypothetical protein